MDPQTSGLFGGLAGGLVGTLGGAVGTYFSIRNTAGPRERAFVVRASVLCWVAVVLFLIALILTPRPYAWLLWVPYSLLLPLAILAWNRRQALIRSEEALHAEQVAGSGGGSNPAE